MKYQADISFTPNSLVYGDCLNVVQQWAAGGMKVDLIYLDPPFNSNESYHVIYDQDRAANAKVNAPQHKAFDDMWDWHEGTSAEAFARLTGLSGAVGNRVAATMHGLHAILSGGDKADMGMLAYVTYMAERLYHLRRVLKDTGSIYLHCDPTASYYLRLVLNAIFGAANYRNEIYWCYGSPSNAKQHFPRKTDTILFYAKGEVNTFNADAIKVPHKRIDKRTVKEGWRRDKPLEYTPEKADELERGKVPFNWWTDIAPAYKSSKEWLKYPTQKPLKLLRRIIAASSNPGDLVLDPFCGCGTAAHAALDMRDAHNNKLPRRQFIGIDISPYAINQVCKARLKKFKGVTVHGIPADIPGLEKWAREKPFDFEQFAVTTVPGMAPNDKQIGDGGVDGWAKLFYTNPVAANGQPLPRDCIAQVKVGKPSVDAIRAFASKLIGGSAAIGIFITLRKQKLTPTMREEINRVGKLKFDGAAGEYDRLVFWSMEEFYADGQLPKMPEFTDPITGDRMHEFIRPD